MAEAILRKLAADRLKCRDMELRERGIDIFSAGVAATENFPASREAIKALGGYNAVDMTNHLSQQVTERMLEESTLVLAMTSHHLQILKEMRPDLSDRFQLLSRSGKDISDPFGCGLEAYQECMLEISENLTALVDELFQKEP